MLGEHHQPFEIVVVESLASDAMAKKKPADNAAPGVHRNDYFRAKGIQSASHQDALGVFHLGQVGAGDQVGVKLEPAHERVSLAVFDLVGFRQTTQAGAKPVAIALSYLGKNAYPADAGGISNTLDHAGEEGFDVVESAENSRETHKWHR